MSEKPNLLCIDDDKRILRSLKALFRSTHNVYATTSPAEFTQLLSEHHMHVVISDQRMPEAQGTELLSFVKNMSPDTMRILLTGYADADAVVDSVNESEIFCYIQKPWEIDEIRSIVQQATDIAKRLEKLSDIEFIDGDDFEPFDELTFGDSVDVIDHRPRVLYLDKDDYSTQLFNDTFASNYDIFSLAEPARVAASVNAKDFAIAVIDATFTSDISSLIGKLKQENPLLLPIVLSHTNDSELLVTLINKKQIFRFCNKDTLSSIEESLRVAVDESQRLLSEPKARLQHLLIDGKGTP